MGFQGGEEDKLKTHEAKRALYMANHVRGS